MQQQNLTVRLDREVIKKAKVLAARRGLSVSGLVASQIEALAAEEDRYEKARRQAFSLLDNPWHLGGEGVDRDRLHER